MGRKKKLAGATLCTYYVQPHHKQTLQTVAAREGRRSESEALRMILDQAAIAYGVPIPEQGNT